jgi:glycerol uptake facilitator-like aquaporin
MQNSDMWCRWKAGQSLHEVGSALGKSLTLSVANTSGGAFNPAAAVGIPCMGLSTWPNIWIYLVADCVGGAVAAGAFKAVNPDIR